MVVGSGEYWAPVWQCHVDGNHWADYTLEESQDLDGMMTAGVVFAHMVEHKWRNYIFVINSTGMDPRVVLHGNQPRHMMFQYNVQLQTQRQIRRMLGLTM